MTLAGAGIHAGPEGVLSFLQAACITSFILAKHAFAGGNSSSGWSSKGNSRAYACRWLRLPRGSSPGQARWTETTPMRSCWVGAGKLLQGSRVWAYSVCGREVRRGLTTALHSSHPQSTVMPQPSNQLSVVAAQCIKSRALLQCCIGLKKSAWSGPSPQP